MANRIVDILSRAIGLSPQEESALDIEFSRLEGRANAASRGINNSGGSTGVSSGNVSINTEGGITLYNPNLGVRSIFLDEDGDAFFGIDIDTPSLTSLAIFSNSQRYNREDFGSGDLLIGDNSVGVPTANLFWDRSSGRLNFRTGTTTKGYIDTDGKIVMTLADLGGWNLDATRIYSDGEEIVLDSANQRIEVGSSDEILIDGGNALIRSGNFTSDVSGWQIDNEKAEFQNIIARGEFSAAVFTKDLIDARAGSMIVAKSAGKLDVQMNIPGSGTWEMVITDPPTGAAFLFENGDTCRITGQYTQTGAVFTTYFSVASRVDNGDGTQSYTCTWISGSRPITGYAAGTPVVDLGVSGDGFLFMTADDGNAPYYSVRTWASTPTTLTERVRIGNLNGYLGYASDLFGIGIGSSASNQANMTYDPTNGLRLRIGTTTHIHFTNAGAANITGQMKFGAGGRILLGSTTSDGVEINSSGIFGRDGGVEQFAIQTDGKAKFAARNIVMDADGLLVGSLTNGIQLTSSFLQGWGGGTKQFYLDASDGSAYFGGGDVQMDANGLKLLDTGAVKQKEIRWFDTTFSGDEVGRIYGDAGGTDAITWIIGQRDTGYTASYAGVILAAIDFAAGIDARAWVTTENPLSSSRGRLRVTGADITQDDGDIYTKAWTDYSGTSTIVGWSSFTTKILRYKKIGKTVFVEFRLVGTSNATTTTFTLPVAPWAGGSAIYMPTIRIQDAGGAYSIGMLQYTHSSTTVTLFSSVTGSTWTASGTKFISGQFWYETA